MRLKNNIGALINLKFAPTQQFKRHLLHVVVNFKLLDYCLGCHFLHFSLQHLAESLRHLGCQIYKASLNLDVLFLTLHLDNNLVPNPLFQIKINQLLIDAFLIVENRLSKD